MTVSTPRHPHIHVSSKNDLHELHEVIQHLEQENHDLKDDRKLYLQALTGVLEVLNEVIKVVEADANPEETLRSLRSVPPQG